MFFPAHVSGVLYCVKGISRPDPTHKPDNPDPTRLDLHVSLCMYDFIYKLDQERGQMRLIPNI